MKKLLAILLVLTLVCALFAGCAAKEETPAEPSASAEPSEAPVSEAPSAEPSEEPSAEKPSIGFIIMGMNEFFQEMADVYVRIMTEAGWEADYADGKFDPTVQMEAMENYTAMGKDVIVILPVSGEALSSAAKTAMDAGIIIISMVNPTDTYDACMVSDPALVAKGICEMASDWADERFPDAEAGSIPVAILAYTGDYNSVVTNAALEEIESYNPKFKLVTEVESNEQSAEIGMSGAENVMTTNPEVQVILCCSGSTALGVNNFFTGISSPVEDLSTIAVYGGSTGSEVIYAAIRDSAENTAVYRGLCVASGVEATVMEILELASGLMDGSMTAPVNRTANVENILPSNVADYMG